MKRARELMRNSFLGVTLSLLICSPVATEITQAPRYSVSGTIPALLFGVIAGVVGKELITRKRGYYE